MLIPPAFAQTASDGGGNLLFQLLPFALIFVVFYFLLIRPQRQKVKQHQEMVASLRRGDTIVTNGGLIGKIHKVVDDFEVVVDLGENQKVRVVRGMIQEVRSKGEPVKESD